MEAEFRRLAGAFARGAAPDPKRLTVRQLLQRFGYQKRGDWINNHIRNGLERFKLRTDQDFTIAWLDSPVVIELDSPRTPRPSDPTRRVGALDAANRKPVSVSPDGALSEATTKMRMNGYSRLPVMRNERDVKGMVTWESIGARMALGVACAHVRDCVARFFDQLARMTAGGRPAEPGVVRAGTSVAPRRNSAPSG